MFRKFLFGSIVGALAMYWWIHHAPLWMGKGAGWLDDAASGYRGDERRERARDVLR